MASPADSFSADLSAISPAAALADAQRLLAQRQTLYRFYDDTPAAVCVLRGPAHHYEYLNAAYQRLLPGRQLLGLPVTEALPELVSTGILALLDGVYQTGTTYHGTEQSVALAATADQPAEERFFTFTYQAIREQGTVVGISAFATDVTEQVRARRQQEAQRRQLADLFEQAPVGIATFRGPRYVIEMANPAVCALWGRTPAQAVGTLLFELLPEAAGQGFEELLDGVLATGEPYVAHELPSIIDREGRRDTVYWDFVYHPLRETDGRITGITMVATEVSASVLARRQVEQLNAELEARVRARTRELGEQQALLNQILGQTPAYIATLSGPELRFSFLNHNYQRLLGGQPALGRPLAEVQPDAVAQGFGEMLGRIGAGGPPVVSPTTPLWRTQSVGQQQLGYYDLTYAPLRNAQGEPRGVLAFGVEVTEQVLARQEREAQRQLLQSVFEQSPTALFVVRGPDYVLEVVNPLMARILGHAPTELLGRPYLEAVPELQGQGIAELLDQVWHTGQPYSQQERPARLAYHQPGQPGYYTFVYQPLLDEQDVVAAIACVAVDVTEQVSARQQVQALNEELTGANQALQQTNQQLRRTNADLDTFVYTASHDLKSPITNLEGLLVVLRDTLPVEVQQQSLVAPLLDLLDGTVARFRLTIEQLTELIRLQQTPAGPAQLVPLGPLVAAVLADLAAEVTAAQAQVHVAIADGLGLHFAPANLRSIVYNLLSNALKYHDPARPAQVTVRAERQPAAVVLTVQDNGLGMSASQQERLFQAFQRLHTHVEGTGVGLYMIKRLIENAGARIAVASQLGEGATFTVTFPS
ncbi:PAS domain-containing protein [Hymenobacter sp. BT559]|uniref:PAS domain-containing sensor histidine kinase n=1 Tax=Hymenobacter sp. BT559 TaxID=2795729 RepID=UPI0018EA6DB2|nr:PAS domain-containing protein [Hymenobacter sp. BT559]MBJ6146120.1 PAS domain-containing protein [Hymenobacter sp. BT559]